jgi:hypothetical protein
MQKELEFSKIVKQSNRIVTLFEMAKVPVNPESISACILTALLCLDRTIQVDHKDWLTLCDSIWNAYREAKRRGAHFGNKTVS